MFLPMKDVLYFFEGMHRNKISIHRNILFLQKICVKLLKGLHNLHSSPTVTAPDVGYPKLTAGGPQIDGLEKLTSSNVATFGIYVRFLGGTWMCLM